MQHLKRHIANHVLSAVLMVLAVLLGLFAVSMFADEVKERSGQYGLQQIVQYVALRLPGLAVSNTGFAMLIGCLMGLGVLAGQSELTVMRASGVSILRIVWMVLRPMLLLMLLVSLAGEYAVPAIDSYAARLRTEAVQQQSGSELDSRHGLWLRHNNDFLHFSHVLADGTIYGFSRLSFDASGELQYAQYAPRAQHTAGGWQLERPRVTRFGSDRVSVVAEDSEAIWQSELPAELLNAVVSEPGSMSLRELYRYIGYLREHAQDSRQFSLVFWQKLMQPLAMIGLVLVAISFIFGPLRESTMGYRLFTGVMVGIIFRFSQDLLGPTSLVYGFSPIAAVAAPIALCWLLGLLLLVRTR